MEGVNNNKTENIASGFEELQKKDKLKVILDLFGSDAARDAFLDTCKGYVAACKVSLPGADSENYSSRQQKYYPPQRAHLHNSIMDTLSRLAVQSKELSPLQQEILREMHDRNTAGEIIRAYVLALENAEDEDEIEEQNQKRKEKSGVAYFHSLEKEH